MRSDSQSSGDAELDIRGLGSASGKRPIGVCRSQAGKCGTNGIDTTEGRAYTRVKIECDILKKATAYFARESV